MQCTQYGGGTEDLDLALDATVCHVQLADIKYWSAKHRKHSLKVSDARPCTLLYWSVAEYQSSTGEGDDDDDNDNENKSTEGAHTRTTATMATYSSERGGSFDDMCSS